MQMRWSKIILLCIMFQLNSNSNLLPYIQTIKKTKYGGIVERPMRPVTTPLQRKLIHIVTRKHEAT